MPSDTVAETVAFAASGRDARGYVDAVSVLTACVPFADHTPRVACHVCPVSALPKEPEVVLLNKSEIALAMLDAIVPISHI